MGIIKQYLQEDVLSAARKRFEFLYQEFEHIYVAFSGGKDSTVCLHLAIEAAEKLGRLPVRVLFVDQEAEWQHVIDYVRIVMHDERVKPFWLQVPIKMNNASSVDEPWMYCWQPGVTWMRDKEPDSIHENVYGTDLFKGLFGYFGAYHHPKQQVVQITGMRCEESPSRSMSLTYRDVYKGITWGAKDTKFGRKHYHLSPIFDWGYKDVWKYIHEKGVEYCNTGEAPIWMGDFSFRRLDQVRPGDEVIGFTFPAHKGDGENRSQLIRTKVLASSCRLAPVVRIRLESGREIRCTPDHRWVRKSPAGAWQKGVKQFGPARVGEDLAHVIDPFMSEPSPNGMWLGGIYDGEGGGWAITQSTRVNAPICEKIRSVLAELGTQYREDSEAIGRSGCTRFVITGGRQELVRFFNQTRPVKAAYIDRGGRDRFGHYHVLGGRFKTPDRVVSIEPDGEDLVYSLETECGTYVAWGFASKNCSLYDLMYQHNLPLHSMRVSCVTHEQATKTLYFLQEIEPDTWNRLSTRLRGINSVAQLRGDFYMPKDLPFMFKDWVEYRDHLLKHLTDDTGRKFFKPLFAKYDAMYEHADPALRIKMQKVQISMVLRNDWEEGVGLKAFRLVNPDPARAARRVARRKRILEGTEIIPGLPARGTNQ